MASAPHIQGLETISTYEPNSDGAQRMRSDFALDEVDLAEVVEVWGYLDAPIKSAIMALIRS